MRTYDYQPPSSDDYGNVAELNQAWLKATTDMHRPQRSRLAEAPFLLFTLREYDLEWWREALQEKSQADWMQHNKATESLFRIHSAALGFLWQLALRNPYAARLVSGASITWCEMLTEVPLVKLIDQVADRADLSRSRLDIDTTAFFNADCTSAQKPIRRASHFVALQSLLTTPVVDHDHSLRSAACRMPRARLKVADKLKE